MYNQGKKTVIRMLGKYNPRDNKHSLQSFFCFQLPLLSRFSSAGSHFTVSVWCSLLWLSTENGPWGCNRQVIFVQTFCLRHWSFFLRPNTCSSWYPVSSTTLTPSSTPSCTPSCPSASGEASMTWRAPAVHSGWENMYYMMRRMRKYQP